jgi:hypothetical protein
MMSEKQRSTQVKMVINVNLCTDMNQRERTASTNKGNVCDSIAAVVTLFVYVPFKQIKEQMIGAVAVASETIGVVVVEGTDVEVVLTDAKEDVTALLGVFDIDDAGGEFAVVSVPAVVEGDVEVNVNEATLTEVEVLVMGT